ncbi:bile acid:sodium symporter family protein [Nonomuraea sp. NPDC049269]|uniref:bile acid:sodium symporter family protein n=1 Tax=Nonomuraea sp. NPDC049269 TaxID=3364349 RepID=UPI00371E0977
MNTLQLLFNAVTVVFIAATMFAAGLATTLPALCTVFTDLPLLLLVLLANLVCVPLLGWGVAALFGLPAASFIALLLVASSPGGPFGAKLAMVQNGDVVAGAATQVLLAAIGSVTFGPTVNVILKTANVGGGVSLDVATLMLTVAVLQLVPFAVGLIVRHYAASTAQAWHPVAAVVSNVTFLVVLVGMLVGNWRAVIALIGSLTLLTGFVFAIIVFALGTALATGPWPRRTTPVRGLVFGLAAGLAMVILMWLTVGSVVSTLVAGAVSALAVGLAHGTASGFAAWAEAPTPEGQASTPLTSWRADRTLNLVRAGTIGFSAALTGGLAAGLAAGLTETPAFGFSVGLVYALAFGLTAGLAAGHHHAWMAYLIATIRLALAGRLPRKLMLFLDDAHRLSLLRAVGPIYQFRHAELQDHLAAAYRASEPTG